MELCVPAASLLNFCSLNLRPPRSAERPSTRRRLPTIEPISEARTTSTSPLITATIAMMSSVALPKVAFRRGPSDRLSAILCQLLRRVSHQSGKRNNRETGGQKTQTGGALNTRISMLMGTKASMSHCHRMKFGPLSLFCLYAAPKGPLIGRVRHGPFYQHRTVSFSTRTVGNCGQPNQSDLTDPQRCSAQGFRFAI